MTAQADNRAQEQWKLNEKIQLVQTPSAVYQSPRSQNIQSQLTYRSHLRPLASG